MLEFEVSFSTDDPEYNKVLWDLSNFLVQENKFIIGFPTFFAYIHHFFKRVLKRKYPVTIAYQFSADAFSAKISGMTVTFKFDDLDRYVLEESFVLLYFNVYFQIYLLKRKRKFRFILPQYLLSEEQRSSLQMTMSNRK